jgi:hypothetical protein
MSEITAHQLSTISGIVLLVIYTWIVLPWLRLGSPGDAWTTGGLWFGLTVAFEFLFGHFVAGHSWSRLLQDYNFLEGRVWLLVLAAILVVPRVIFQIRHTGRTT